MKAIELQLKFLNNLKTMKDIYSRLVIDMKNLMNLAIYYLLAQMVNLYLKRVLTQLRMI